MAAPEIAHLRDFDGCDWAWAASFRAAAEAERVVRAIAEFQWVAMGGDEGRWWGGVGVR